MKSTKNWHIVFEIISIGFTIGLAYLLIYFVKPFLSFDFFRTTFIFLFFAIFFGLKIVFIDRGLIHFFWIKLIVFLVNLPLFFYLIRTFQYNMQVFDGFEYKIEPGGISEIWPNINLETLFYIKNLYVFGGVFAIISLVLLQFKIIAQIFKKQQIPEGLMGGNKAR